MNGRIVSLQKAAKEGLVAGFVEQEDRLGVIAFATGSEIKVPINRTATPGFDRTQVNTAIDSLLASGWTATSDAIRKATDELLSIPDASRSRRQAIVVFSDGLPNVVAIQSGDARYNLSRSINRYDPDKLNASTDIDVNPLTAMPASVVGGISTTGRIPLNPSAPLSQCVLMQASINAAENAAQRARQQGIVIYSIGYGSALDHLESAGARCGLNNDSIGSSVLRRMANLPLQQCFARIAQRIKFPSARDNNDVR